MPIENIAAYAKELHEHFDNEKHGDPLRFGEWDCHKPGWDTVRTEAGWHVLGEYPSRLIAVQYPTEDKYWFEWRKANYQPVTRGPVQDTIKNVTRLFSDTGLVALNVAEDVQEYISEEAFEGVDFKTFMIRSAWNLDSYDPNAYVVAFPDGRGVTDPGVRVEVKLKLIESGNIFDANSEVLSWRWMKGKYWIIDDEWYYFVRDAGGGKLEITEWYRHGTGTVIGQVLGGIPQNVHGHKLYKSFFDAYFPFANEAAKAYSVYQVTTARMGFPIKEVENRPCDYQGEEPDYRPCSKGKIFNPDGSISTCPQCGGTGQQDIKPGDTLIRREMPPDIPQDPTPALRFIEMPTSIPVMSENWQVLRKLAKEELDKRYVLEAQSGTAKEADREGEYNFMIGAAEWWFGTVIENTLYDITKLLRPFDWQNNRPTVLPPKDFKLKGAEELLEELKSAKDSGAPSGVLVETSREYAKKKYARDTGLQRKLFLQLMLDPLAALSEDERQAKRFSGGADDRAMWINANAYSLIEQIAGENPANLDRDDIWWRGEFEKRVAALFTPPPATLTDALAE